MSMKIVRLSSLLFAFVLAASAFCFDLPALAGNAPGQNANSSTTTAENSNASTKRGRSRRRGRRAAASSEGTPVPSSELIASAASIDTTEQTDLSGTYAGTFDCSDAGVAGDTTLTITGNQFTLADGKTGRIVAETTRGYTGATMQFGEFTMPAPGQPASAPLVIISMRARKSGDRLTLTPIEGEKHVCSFTPAGASGGPRTRHRRGRRAAAPSPPAAGPAMPADTMAPPETSTEPVAPASRRRGRRGRRGNQNTNSNANVNDNTGANPTKTPTPDRN